MDEIEIDREALIATFAIEARELLDEMERHLLALEAAPRDLERLRALFRAAHTLKGGASTVGFDGPRDLAHDLEGLLDAMRSGRSPATHEVVTLLLGAVDQLRRSVGECAAGRTEEVAEATALRARLSEFAARPGASPSARPVPEAPARPSGSSVRTLRVAVAKLDRMMDLAGEIAISRGRLTDTLERGLRLSPQEILDLHRETDRLFMDIQELIMKARMVPLRPVFQQQLRTARDAAASTGRRVQLVIEGADVEMDTAVVEIVRDPIGHLVRNAVGHGIELPETRRAAGKDPCGRVTLRGFRDPGGIVIQVADDGGGLDHDRIASRGEAIGLVSDPAKLSPQEIAHLVFEPGLSTSEDVTAISGRGVGMDVVRRNVEALRGSVAVESAKGRGTTITMRLPLTLAIIQGFRVAAGGQTYVLPLDAVVECLELPAADRDLHEGAGVIDLRGQPLPYLRLRNHFGLAGPPPRRENVVVVRHGEALAGLAVDGLPGESQTVIKPLGPMFQGLPGVAGASILGDGKVALILDVAGLLRQALRGAVPSPVPELHELEHT